MRPSARFRLLPGTILLFTLAVTAGDVKDGNFGAERPGTTQTAKSAPHARRTSYPFFGELEPHDAKSLTLKGKKKARVLLVTSDTRVLKNGATAKLSDATVGERVSGSARKNAEGKEEAVTINLK
jgi:hypothetical protein